MSVRYTRPAARQLAAVLEHITEHSPQGAHHVLNRLEQALALVAEHPRIGRATNRPGFRRINLHPYPYSILYRADSTGIVIHAIRHAARPQPRW